MRTKSTLAGALTAALWLAGCGIGAREAVRGRENGGASVGTVPIERIRDVARRVLEQRNFTVDVAPNSKGPDGLGMTVYGTRSVRARFKKIDAGIVQIGPGDMEEVQEGGEVYRVDLTVEINRKWNEADWQTASAEGMVFRCDGGYYSRDGSGQFVRELELDRKSLADVEQAIKRELSGGQGK